MSIHAHNISSTSTKEILTQLKSNKEGLSQKEAENRLQLYGKNTLCEKKEVGIILEFFSHFANPLIIVLLCAASISAYFGEIKNFVVILTMILASVILDFFEEHSANNAAKKLKEKVSITATVLRNGKKQEVHSSDICVGDIIFLSSGDLIPADARIIESTDLFVNQSALTGESYPQEKTANKETNNNLHEQRNIVFLGTNVVSGTALAVVFQIGKNTEFGKISKSILQKEEKSEFEMGITKFGFLITKIILVLVLIIFFGNAIIDRDILESFIFAIAIAVGVTPELLPVIMSITMARGSQKMAKSGVIVKKLSSIPNFGSMDILCTDKTGTLTEDNIELVSYTDIYGTPDEQVFLSTYLSSFHQTGVKNPLDKAVLSYKKANIKEYKKVREIPFDFVRKMMSVIVKNKTQEIFISKGAPESILEKCTHYKKNNKTITLSKALQIQTHSYYQKLSSEGYRVLAVAQKEITSKENSSSENNLTLLGFVAFLDPAKKDAGKILKSLESHGVEVKVITGDNELVTEKICKDIELPIKGILLGHEIEKLTDDALAIRAENTTIFARFSPEQKNRIILALRKQGHVVGYMGDGINDAPSLKSADVGISVEHAVDVAKEAADIILTEKHLRPIIAGIIEGRRSFGNTMKYLMMGLSSNFGNMFSVLFAIFYLPFLPMIPIQILLNNFIYDFSQVTIPSDKVDADWIRKPHKWNFAAVKKFMYVFGPISSLFDIFTFILLFSVFHLTPSQFQTGWFLESLATQTLVIHIIRTRHLPFIQSRASKFLLGSTLIATAIGWIIPFTHLGKLFHFSPLPPYVLFSIIGIVLCYLCVIEITKRIYYKKYQF